MKKKGISISAAARADFLQHPKKITPKREQKKKEFDTGYISSKEKLRIITFHDFV